MTIGEQVRFGSVELRLNETVRVHRERVGRRRQISARRNGGDHLWISAAVLVLCMPAAVLLGAGIAILTAIRVATG
jgi:hypothetical protein